MHNLKAENYALLGRLTEDLSLGYSLSDLSEGLFQRDKGCHLQIGTCHLPLQGSNYELLQLLTFNIP